MDHEWFTEQLAPDQVGWDWFSIQLDNHTELMLFELRRKDGSIDPYSSGTFIDARGVARHLQREDFTLQPLSYWQKYPVEWRLRVPSLNIDLTCTPVLPIRNYAAIPATGKARWIIPAAQTGVGYLEMTGYEAPVKF